MFDPKPTKYPFPELTDKHYLVVKKNRGLTFDKDYPYVENSAWFRIKQAGMRFLLHILAFPVMRVRLGLKVEGRENLKKHRDVLNRGVISCSNHVHLWDYLAILSAIRPKNKYVLVWAPNINGENGKMMRLVGGIPVPETGVSATTAQLEAVGGILNDGKWLQIYAEGSMWEFYQPIRPFKRGIAYLACRFGKPILPMGFSYREPGPIRKHVFKQSALFTLHIGEPLFADPALTGKEQETDLLRRAHEAVCGLVGIEPGTNIYPPVYDNTRRVDYY